MAGERSGGAGVAWASSPWSYTKVHPRFSRGLYFWTMDPRMRAMLLPAVTEARPARAREPQPSKPQNSKWKSAMANRNRRVAPNPFARAGLPVIACLGGMAWRPARRRGDVMLTDTFHINARRRRRRCYPNLLYNRTERRRIPPGNTESLCSLRYRGARSSRRRLRRRRKSSGK